MGKEKSHAKKKLYSKKNFFLEFPGRPEVRTLLFQCRDRVRYLDKEPRSPKLHGAAKKIYIYLTVENHVRPHCLIPQFEIEILGAYQ